MFEEEGYVEAMHPVLLDNLVDALEEVYLDWERSPESKFGMRKYEKKFTKLFTVSVGSNVISSYI